MTIIITFLHAFGLARPIASTLNAHKANKVLWKRVEIVSLLLASILAVIIIGLVGAININYIGAFSSLALSVPPLIITTLILLEIVVMADGYQKERELFHYPGGWWMMFKVK